VRAARARPSAGCPGRLIGPGVGEHHAGHPVEIDKRLPVLAHVPETVVVAAALHVDRHDAVRYRPAESGTGWLAAARRAGPGPRRRSSEPRASSRTFSAGRTSMRHPVLSVLGRKGLHGGGQVCTARLPRSGGRQGARAQAERAEPAQIKSRSGPAYGRAVPAGSADRNTGPSGRPCRPRRIPAPHRTPSSPCSPWRETDRAGRRFDPHR
jgi:hypothetical protein